MGAAEESGIIEPPDIDKTDKLPVLDVAAYEASTGQFSTVQADDTGSFPTLAAHTEVAAAVPRRERRLAPRAAPAVGGEAARIGNVDLPSLTESVRSVEEKIARQNAQQEALRRDLEKSRAAEAAAEMRSGALLAELASLRALLDAERERVRLLDQSIQERGAAADQARARGDEATRETERLRGEANSLRETLAARETNLTQTLLSLGERDTQHAALHREHAKLTQSLDESAQYISQLETDLHQTTTRLNEVRQEFDSHVVASAQLTRQNDANTLALQRTEAELTSLRVVLADHQERLRSREYRRGSYESAMRALDAEAAAERRRALGLQSERDALSQRFTSIGTQLAAREAELAEALAQLESQTATLAGKGSELVQIEASRTEMRGELAAIKADRDRLAQSLNTKESEVAAGVARRAELERQIAALQAVQATQSARLVELDKLAAEAERGRRQNQELAQSSSELLAAAQRAEADHAARADRLAAELAAAQDFITTTVSVAETTKSDLMAREGRLSESIARIEQLEALQADSDKTIAELRADMAAMHELLDEAQAPTKALEEKLAVVTAELAARTAKFADLDAENSSLKAALDRTRGALEEREFLIRRLERSAATSAQALGRIQNSIERLGEPGDLESSLSLPAQNAMLTRIDSGGDAATILLGRRTRVGRAAENDFRIDSTSVSRHHALIIAGPRYAIVEDLNSTNGVFINENKVVRGKLKDGDTLTIGEVKFRFMIGSAAPESS